MKREIHSRSIFRGCLPINRLTVPINCQRGGVAAFAPRCSMLNCRRGAEQSAKCCRSLGMALTCRLLPFGEINCKINLYHLTSSFLHHHRWTLVNESCPGINTN
ncbi:hypothetical protein PUN28_009609 [Cardiocondyla obscurior]|uniref:Uncharacterized protein n=1 Tax=Cardiocondyla obscurior TaxID=286306 RepID=A0AAW2FWD6_9HYME